MMRFIAHRCLQAVPVLFLVSAVVFGTMHLIPGDPVDALFPPDAAITPDAKNALRRRLGLDQALPVQYLSWVERMLRGDWGTSIASRQPVGWLVAEAWPRTGALALASLGIGVATAVPVGVLLATRQGTIWDVLGSATAMLGISLPTFALGILFMLVFSVRLHWLPSLGSIVLPAFTQGVGIAAILLRTVRADVIHQLRAEYIRTAQAKGLTERVVLTRHVLRNALAGTVTVAGWIFGYQLGGAVVIERVFTWPGVGLLTVNAIYSRDYPVVLAAVLVFAATYVLVNLVVDVAYAVLDPRIRYA
jgi:ABC-type dipeptide/oligopeptide/nickel transport system permease component